MSGKSPRGQRSTLTVAEEEAREANPTLKERGLTYGPYKTNIQVRMDILNTLKTCYKDQHGEDMSEEYVQYFWDIANKLCRLAISPHHIDSWCDIKGYAGLIEATLIDNGDGI